MADNQIQIIQTEDPADYCRRFNGATFDDYDSTLFDHTNTVEKELWADNQDFVYVGKDTTFFSVGFMVGTVPVGYGTFLFEYAASGSYSITGVNQGTKTFTIAESKASQFTDGTHFTISGSTGNDGTYTVNGDATGTTDIVVDQAIPDATVDGTISTIWTAMTAADNALQNLTAEFTKDGLVAWSIPGDWGSRTVDSQSAFWVRATQAAAAPGTPATALNLLLNLTLDAPLVLDNILPDPEVSFSRDTSGFVKKNDLITSEPRNLPVDCTELATDWQGMFLLNYWRQYRRKLFIDDLARTVPISISGDSYYQNYDGFLVQLDGRATSFHKQDVEIFRIEFMVDTVTTIATILGLPAA